MKRLKSDKTNKDDFACRLSEAAAEVDASLRRLLGERVEANSVLEEAMRYTLESPGKRIRGSLVLWCCELISGTVNDTARVAAAAVEMVHAYSLVHDDLPAMDDDDMRRGRATCHRVYDEATAILTGDALLTLAFEVLSEKVSDPSVAVRLIRTLSTSAGAGGMIAGQMADINSAGHTGSLSLLRHIHIHKTAEMFAASAGMGAIAAGASDEQIESLLKYGLEVGLGFQVCDDMLDVSETSERLGKTAGKDLAQGKVTYPSVVGMEESRRIAEKIRDEAIAALEGFGEDAEVLRQLAGELLGRVK